ncbi:MAG: hypothetical protein NZ523_11360 [Elioraea sp.]|nr:hypothetical protein [Elioraea sp.]
MTQPAGCVLHGLARAVRSRAQPVGERQALVPGGGAIGPIAALFPVAWGGRQASFAETRPAGREAARRAGVAEVFAARRTPAPESLFDLVSDAIASGVIRRAASAAVAPWGDLVHIGLPDCEAGLDTRRMTLQEVALVGSLSSTCADLRDAPEAPSRNVSGDLSRVEERALSDRGAACAEAAGCCAASPRIILRP